MTKTSRNRRKERRIKKAKAKRVVAINDHIHRHISSFDHCSPYEYHKEFGNLTMDEYREKLYIKFEKQLYG